MKSIGVGIIGAGERGVHVLGARLAEMVRETRLRIVALCDVDERRLAEGKAVIEAMYAEAGVQSSIRTFSAYEQLIGDESVECVFVTTFTSFHRGPTVAALKAGKPVYLDKPMATTEEDGAAILEAERSCGRSVIMGFTRRYEHSWREAYEYVRSGAIGDLQMILLRSIIPYARYLQRWHRESNLSGGGLNDKVAHYYDVLNWFAGSTPTVLSAMGGRSSVFAPDETAPLRCRDCDRICPFRAVTNNTVHELGQVYRLDAEYRKQKKGVFSQASWTDAREDTQSLDNCVFHADENLLDHAVVSISYANGVKASIFWTIFGPNADDEESIELIGSSGRLRLTRNTGAIDIVSDYGLEEKTIDARGKHFGSSHFGADIELIRTIEQYCDGASPPVTTEDGFNALMMVEATQRSLRSEGVPVALDAVETEHE